MNRSLPHVHPLSFIHHPFGDLYMPIHFGTDGWRAVISDSFTFDNLRIVTQAIADAVASDHWDKSTNGENDPDADLHGPDLLAKIEHAIGSSAVATCDAQALSAQLLGDTLTANVLLLGFAWQQGLVPLSRASIERALELNGVSVEDNIFAFACGRLAAANPPATSIR